MKSISEEKTAAPNAADKRPQPRTRRNDRSAKNAKWVESLRSSDVNRLWTELHRIVSHHPLVRASRSAGLLVEEGDNQPLPIEKATVLLPSYSIRLFRPADQPLRVLYGKDGVAPAGEGPGGRGIG